MPGFRIATFNVENLFSRPKLLNYQDNDAARPLLNAVTRLQGLIARPSYTPATKEEILALLDQLAPYIRLVEIHGKLVGRRKVDGTFQTVVVASGRGDWVGGLAYEREYLAYSAQQNTARVLAEVNADVLCTVEVEDRPTLSRFARAYLGGLDYRYDMSIEGNDERGIDVGLLCRFEVADLRSHVHDRVAESPKTRVFSRDCLEACVLLPDGGHLWMLLNHFKSKGYGRPQDNDARRKLQAARVADVLGRFDLARDLVCVAGDLNDTPDGAPLAPLLDLEALHDVLALQFPDPADRWTYHFRRKEQIDYLLVSEALRARFQRAGIERRGLYRAGALTDGAVEAFHTVTDAKSAASDHCAIWADFTL